MRLNPLTNYFQLLLFSTDPQIVKEAESGGVDGIIVDWETAGKKDRQTGYDTQINEATLDDLINIRKIANGRVICRINGINPTTKSEVDQAIGSGVDEILLPMVRSKDEVERCLELINNRCMLGILVETLAATEISDELNKLPLSRVYFGLNDLAIDRKLTNIFTSVEDGLVEKVRRFFTLPFGFGGLTLPDRGNPIPCKYLMGEMTRLNCSFSFLRRSFLRDVHGKDIREQIPIIRSTIQEMAVRSFEQVLKDQAVLLGYIQKFPATITPRGS
jgi:hypothetical protein